MKRSIWRVLLKTIGWFMIVIGSCFVFGDDTVLIHYLILIFGIIMIGFYFPYQDAKQ